MWFSNVTKERIILLFMLPLDTYIEKVVCIVVYPLELLLPLNFVNNSTLYQMMSITQRCVMLRCYLTMTNKIYSSSQKTDTLLGVDTCAFLRVFSFNLICIFLLCWPDRCCCSINYLFLLLALKRAIILAYDQLSVCRDRRDVGLLISE